MITAFFRAAAAPVQVIDVGKAGGEMAAGGPEGRRLPCPCSARRAMAPRMRLLSALAVAGLTALAVLCLSGPAVRAQPTVSSVSRRRDTAAVRRPSGSR